MLKLTYVENDFFLERLDVTLEEWVAARVFLCVRASSPFYVEPSAASFLLPADLPDLSDLEAIVAEGFEFLSITPVDAGYVEIGLEGTWLSSEPDSEEGVFACAIGDRAELLLSRLWLEAQLGASVIGE